jgi:hypothetical protein
MPYPQGSTVFRGVEPSCRLGFRSHGGDCTCVILDESRYVMRLRESGRKNSEGSSN